MYVIYYIYMCIEHYFFFYICSLSKSVMANCPYSCEWFKCSEDMKPSHQLGNSIGSGGFNGI